uniref:Transposase n=1 Tax=Ditylenchus dipsaci TaxID=166011 RepID=A0A915DTT5_9BILA
MTMRLILIVILNYDYEYEYELSYEYEFNYQYDISYDYESILFFCSMSTNSDNSPSQASNFAKKRSRDAVWENFTEIEVLGEFKMKCNECQLVFFPTSSFVLHKHTDKEQPAKKICLSQNEGSGEPKEKLKKIQSVLAAVLSIPSLPINIFLHPLVRKLFHVMCPSYELPSSFNTLKSLVLNQFKHQKVKIKEELSKISHRFSLTCDVWTDSSMKSGYLGNFLQQLYLSYFFQHHSGVTLHYCDASAILRRAFLGLQQLKGSHTGQLIRRETEKILAEYGLSLFNAFKVVTDAGSNMIKGFNEIRAVDIDPELISEEFEGALEEEVEDVEDNIELTDIDFLLQ